MPRMTTKKRVLAERGKRSVSHIVDPCRSPCRPRPYFICLVANLALVLGQREGSPFQVGLQFPILKSGQPPRFTVIRVKTPRAS